MNAVPPLPAHIGPLRPDSVYESLRRREPSMWTNPNRCIVCSGAGVFRYYNHALGQIEDWTCNCREQWILYVHLLNAGIPLAYQQLGWNDITSQIPDAVIDRVSEYILDMKTQVRSGGGFILRGPNGTGKTLLATLLLKEAISQGYSGYFVSFHELLDSYTEGWKSDDAKYRFDSYVGCDFLVIDEMGRTGKGRTNITGSMFDHLMRKRISNRRPTVMTTNKTLDDLRVEFGDTVDSLMNESVLEVEVGGPDFRQATARERTRLEVVNDTRRPVVLG